MKRIARWSLVLGSVAAFALLVPADAEARGGGGGGRAGGSNRGGGAPRASGGKKSSDSSKENFLESMQRDEADEQRGGFRDGADLEVLLRLRAARRGA